MKVDKKVAQILKKIVAQNFFKRQRVNIVCHKTSKPINDYREKIYILAMKIAILR